MHALGMPGVDQLLALKKTKEGTEWLEALVPKDSDEGRHLNQGLSQLLAKWMETGALDKSAKEQFKVLDQRAKEFFDRRIQLYACALQDKEVQGQICVLVCQLDGMFRRGYDNIFEVWIERGEAEDFREWSKCAARINAGLGTDRAQNSTRMFGLYREATNPALKEEYEAVFSDVARETGAELNVAPVKSMVRSYEKAGMRHSKKKRHLLDEMCDTFRGSMKCESVKVIRKVVELICADPRFNVMRLNDRLTISTTAGWRDVLITGEFTDLNLANHVVEIQIHHEKLVSIREDMGGHYVYAIFRSLVESLEVTFGKEEAKTLLDATRDAVRFFTTEFC